MSRNRDERVIALVGQALGALTRALVEMQAQSGRSRGAEPIVPTEGTQPERVLGYIQQFGADGVRRAQILRALRDINGNSLSGAITRLKDRQQIEMLGRGRYRASVELDQARASGSGTGGRRGSRRSSRGR